LSQDDLGNRIDEYVVPYLEGRGSLTPAIPGSTTETQILSPGVPRLHLSVIVISLPGELCGYEPNVPRMCSPDTITLQPKTNGVCVHRVVRANDITLTESHPHLEQSWKVSGLNDGQTDMIPVLVEGTYEQKQYEY